MIIVKRLSVYTLLVFAITGGLATHCTALVDGAWKIVYKDSTYLYSTQPPYTDAFNTWFWREDAVGTHTFNYVDQTRCTPKNPCVKLTAPISTGQGYAPDLTPYINGEMYNNSCVRQGPGHPEKQAYDKLLDLGENPWDTALYAHFPKVLHTNIGLMCNMPYPYRVNPPHPVRENYSENSWNTTTPGLLTANRLAQWISPEKEAWMEYRDFAFNTPYKAEARLAQRIDMTIKAEGLGGGSRGWGLWNTTMDPVQWNFAWFMEIADQTYDSVKKTVDVKPVMLMMTVTGISDGGFCISKLKNPSIYDWHDYSIVWRPDSVEYYVDNKLAAAHTRFVPTQAMSFHNWTDNRNYGKTPPANFPLYADKSNYINRFAVYSKTLRALPDKKTYLTESPQCASFADLGKKVELKEFKIIIGEIIKASNGL